MSILTVNQLRHLLPSNNDPASWLDPLNANLAISDIISPYRVAAFMAQMAHESADFTRLKENLNYGAAGLIATWPSRFDAGLAAAYARQPEKIANKVYANRMGNGSEESGDGWKYRGRGIIQITGKSNYAACSKALYGDYRLLDTPEVLETDHDVIVRSACWFWNEKDLSKLADDNNINEITKRINGGYHGIEDRTARYIAAKSILGVGA